MKFSTVFIFLAMLCTVSFAQCPQVSINAIYTELIDTTVVYSSENELQMDVYDAADNVNEYRPLVILAHGGSFLFGFRFNPTMVFLGEELSKRGYVVASIDYRLMSPFDLLNFESSLDGVCKAIADGRAAVRYFRKSIEEGNPFRIDPDQIYFGGNSAGAVIANHIGFMQEGDVIDPLMMDVLENNGGFEGVSGNEGYSSQVRGVISLAGAIHDVNFITIEDEHTTLISCHTVNDATVPYYCGNSYGLSTLPELCGAGAMLDRTNELGFSKHHHLDFDGIEHVPWEFFSSSQDQMFEFVNNHLFQSLSCNEIDTQIVSLNEGWNLMSTYIDSEDMDIEFLFSSVIEDVFIIKNNEGDAFMPQWGFNSIGPMELGQGYYVKILEAKDLIFQGIKTEPQYFSIELQQGWNTIAYIRDSAMDATSVFESQIIEENLIIVKDGFGNALIPEWDYNGIGNMMPGLGYQIKVHQPTIMQYE